MKKKITIIGLGYVGFPSYLLMLQKKLNVFGYDNDEILIKKIKTGKFISKESSIQKLYIKNLSRIKISNRLEKSDIFIICVPTPIKKGNKADISIVLDIISKLNKIVDNKNCIIIESTCPPLTTKLIYNKLSKKKVMLAYCPERVFPGNTFNEMKNNIKIIGGINPLSSNYAETFYKNLGVKNIIKTNAVEAELIKLTENSFRDTTIAFANEISLISDKYKTDAKRIINIANTHPRISIPMPGIGVGGHCIPVDPYFLIDKKIKSNLIRESRKINNLRPYHIARKIKKFSKLYKIKFNKFPKILLLGKSYKEDIDDIRNSPSIKIFDILNNQGENVIIFDPLTDKKKLSVKEILKFDLIFKLVAHKNFTYLRKYKKINLIDF